MKINYFISILIAALLAPFSNVALADSDGDWIPVADSSKDSYQAKQGSGHVTTVDKKKNSGYVYVYQHTIKADNTIHYGEAVVMLADCHKGYGYVIYNDMNGQYTGKDMFVRFGKTIADHLGSTACTSFDSETGKASSQNDGSWKLVAKSQDKPGKEIYIKENTFRRRMYKGQQSASILERFEDLSEDSSIYHEVIIPVNDCQRGFGTMYKLNFDGELAYKTDIALHGDSVGAAVADEICSKL
jgi:hypothetical protein